MIQLDGITKYYGNFPAITDITFRVEKGEAVGFLGPNGAGKSTTMKIVTGFIPPTTGNCTVANYDVVSQSIEARRHIGYLPETVPLYTDMTISEYLTFMGRIREMSIRRIRSRIDDVIDICRLGDYRNSHIGKLSKGFRQRVGIAQSILHEPEVLVLDEPTIGIDPIQVVETRNLIRNLSGEHTLIVSTHILPEVSMICERVVIIHEGQIVAVDRPENLATRLRGVERIEIDVRGPSKQVVTALKEVEGVSGAEKKRTPDDADYITYEIEGTRGADLRAQIATVITKRGWGLVRLQGVGMTLEEIFLRLTTTEEK